MKKLFIMLFALLIVFGISTIGFAASTWPQWWNCEDGRYPAGATYQPFTHLQIQIVTDGMTFATPGWTWITGGSNWSAVNNSTLVVADGETSTTTPTTVEYYLHFNGTSEPAGAEVICSAWAADKHCIGAIYYWGYSNYAVVPDTVLSGYSYIEASSVPEPSSIIAVCSMLASAGFVFRRRK